MSVVHGWVQVERQVSESCERVPRGGDRPFGHDPSLIRWRYSIGGRLIYGVLGRDDISPTRDQTPVCLHDDEQAQCLDVVIGFGG